MLAASFIARVFTPDERGKYRVDLDPKCLVHDPILSDKQLLQQGADTLPDSGVDPKVGVLGKCSDPKPHPEKPVGGEEPKLTRALPPQDGHLMSQGDELKLQCDAAANTEREQGTEGGKNCEHAHDGTAAINDILRENGIARLLMLPSEKRPERIL
jgi:hypothetical protein